MPQNQDKNSVEHPIRAWRKRQKMTLKQAAAQIPVSHVTWHKWENGVMLPHGANERTLCEISQGELTPNVLRAWPISGSKSGPESAAA